MKDVLCTIGGSIIGSLIEEGVEEFFPGVGELNWTGEIAGAIAGLLGSQFAKKETRAAIESFIKHAYRQINKSTASDNISDDDLRLFSEKFKTISNNTKREILNNFRNLAPYEYEFIKEFLREKGWQGKKGLEGT